MTHYDHYRAHPEAFSGRRAKKFSGRLREERRRYDRRQKGRHDWWASQIVIWGGSDAAFRVLLRNL